MMLRTPAIRRDRPRIRGSPALPARSTSAGLVPAKLSAKNHRCDAKDHARPRKYLGQNTFSKRGVQVQLNRQDYRLPRRSSIKARTAAIVFSISAILRMMPVEGSPEAGGP